MVVRLAAVVVSPVRRCRDVDDAAAVVVRFRVLMAAPLTFQPLRPGTRSAGVHSGHGGAVEHERRQSYEHDARNQATEVGPRRVQFQLLGPSTSLGRTGSCMP